MVLKKVLVIIGIILLSAGIIFFATRRKLQSTDDIENIGEELENYDPEGQKEEIKEVVVSDRTGKYPEDELQPLKEPVTEFISQAMSDIMSYSNADTEYSTRISQYFADPAQFPMVNAEYTSQLADYLQRHSFNIQYETVSVPLIRVAEYEPEGTVITVRGYVTANISSDIAEQKDYDSTFIMDIFLKDGAYKILSLELSKGFEKGIKTYWENDSHTLIQFNGEFVFNWNVDEIIFNPEDDLQENEQ